MSNDHIPHLVEPGGEVCKILASPYSVHFYPDGSARFAHRCDRGDRGVIWCAPLLSSHMIDKAASGLTVTPSVLCSDCGTHGFITNGRWVQA